MNRRDKIRLLNLLIEQEEQQEEDIIKLKNELMLKLGQNTLNELKKYQPYINRTPIIAGKSNKFNIRMMKSPALQFILNSKFLDGNSKYIQIIIWPKIIKTGNARTIQKPLQTNFYHKYNSEIKEAITDHNDYNKLESNIFDCKICLFSAIYRQMIHIDYTSHTNPNTIIVTIISPTIHTKVNRRKNNYILGDSWTYSVEDLAADNLNKKYEKIFNSIKHKVIPELIDGFILLSEEYEEKMFTVYTIFKKYNRLDLYKKLITP